MALKINRLDYEAQEAAEKKAKSDRWKEEQKEKLKQMFN